jgi:hypothetical protein
MVFEKDIEKIIGETEVPHCSMAAYEIPTRSSMKV